MTICIVVISYLFLRIIFHKIRGLLHYRNLPLNLRNIIDGQIPTVKIHYKKLEING